MSNQIDVRTIRRSDHSDWLRLWADYNAFYGRYGDTALPDDVVQSTWERLLDDGVPIKGLIAEWDGRPVGLVHIVYHYNLIKISQTCYLQDLYTDKEARRSGVARTLIDAASRLCSEDGIGDIYWHTQADNMSARKLYDTVARNTDFIVYRAETYEA